MQNCVNRRNFVQTLAGAAALSALPLGSQGTDRRRPNIVLIYVDDLGYGDVGCYGAVKVATPHIDALAAKSIRFTNAHAPSATCTPSRYALLTGEYAWRQKGTGVLPGDARLIIEPGRTTLPRLLKQAGYTTGVVGKWHLGLGNGNVDWNQEISPGPLEIGFDYSYLIPATGDRVPCVYVENRRVVGLDPSDPITVNYKTKVGDRPTGKENPDQLKMHPSHGHDQTIVNGISRIGFMQGGESALWVDEDMADRITGKAKDFIHRNQDHPFFLYFATHDIHVPRVPHSRFAGVSGMGPRGDAIVQLDWCVGQITDILEKTGLADNTIVIFTSDNGPVVDDGYKDQAVELLGGHAPAGPLRGGKYSAFEAGTRVPLLIHWPGQEKAMNSDALVCQIDFLASFAALTRQSLPPEAAPDSLANLPALRGRSATGRDHLVEHAGTLSLIEGDWKYIPPSKGAKWLANVSIESGRDTVPQLYNLKEDRYERTNLAEQDPERVRAMASRLAAIQAAGRTR